MHLVSHGQYTISQKSIKGFTFRGVTTISNTCKALEVGPDAGRGTGSSSMPAVRYSTNISYLQQVFKALLFTVLYIYNGLISSLMNNSYSIVGLAQYILRFS